MAKNKFNAFLIFILFFLIPFYSYAQTIPDVNQGHTIEASKINELIAEINNLRTEVNKLKGTRYIVAKYNSGTTWYEVFNDGWIRQGGVDTRTTTGYPNALTVTYPIAFANTSYSLSVTLQTVNTSGAASVYFGENSRTTSSFSHSSGGSMFKTWVAAGYGNSSSVTSLGATPSY